MIKEAVSAMKSVWKQKMVIFDAVKRAVFLSICEGVKKASVHLEK